MFKSGGSEHFASKCARLQLYHLLLAISARSSTLSAMPRACAASTNGAQYRAGMLSARRHILIRLSGMARSAASVRSEGQADVIFLVAFSMPAW